MTLSWHQQRAAGMHAMPYDIVGHVGDAALLCLTCAKRAEVDNPVFRDQADGTEVCDICHERLQS